jgi:hypothetical protein
MLVVINADVVVVTLSISWIVAVPVIKLLAHASGSQTINSILVFVRNGLGTAGRDSVSLRRNHDGLQAGCGQNGIGGQNRLQLTVQSGLFTEPEREQFPVPVLSKAFRFMMDRCTRIAFMVLLRTTLIFLPVSPDCKSSVSCASSAGDHGVRKPLSVMVGSDVWWNAVHTFL